MITSNGLVKQFEDSGKNQSKFSLDCGVHSSRFNVILKGGKIRMSEIERFCKALECQPGDLIEWEDEDEVQYKLL